MKKIIMAICIFALLISGCTGVHYDNSAKDGKLDIYTKCSDGVVCYYHTGGYAGGMDCFRDADLIDKYCKGEVIEVK